MRKTCARKNSSTPECMSRVRQIKWHSCSYTGTQHYENDGSPYINAST